MLPMQPDGAIRANPGSSPYFSYPRPFGVAFWRTTVGVTAFAKAISLGGKP